MRFKFSDILLFVLLLVLQILILNNIVLFGYATPFVYIYFFIKLPLNFKPHFLIILGFIMGLIVDISLNTPGVNAIATTAVAYLRLPIISMMFSHDYPDSYVPSIKHSPIVFIKFSSVVVFIHHSILFCIETFSLSDPLALVLEIVYSSVLTLLIIFALDSIVGKSIKEK